MFWNLCWPGFTVLTFCWVALLLYSLFKSSAMLIHPIQTFKTFRTFKTLQMLWLCFKVWEWTPEGSFTSSPLTWIWELRWCQFFSTNAVFRSMADGWLRASENKALVLPNWEEVVSWFSSEKSLMKLSASPYCVAKELRDITDGFFSNRSCCFLQGYTDTSCQPSWHGFFSSFHWMCCLVSYCLWLSHNQNYLVLVSDLSNQKLKRRWHCLLLTSDTLLVKI